MFGYSVYSSDIAECETESILLAYYLRKAKVRKMQTLLIITETDVNPSLPVRSVIKGRMGEWYERDSG